MGHDLEIFDIKEIRLTASKSEGTFEIGKAAVKMSLEQFCDVFVEVIDPETDKVVRTVEVKWNDLNNAIKQKENKPNKKKGGSK
jgi:hypothetical protein